MTIEEKAEQYAIDTYELIEEGQYSDERARIQGYLAGAKENGVVWHDLRKNPNDLPKEIKKYLVSDGKISFILQWYAWGWLGNRTDVIAWCEIPQFKE